MSNMNRLCGALAFPFVLPAAAAEAQVGNSALVAPVEASFEIVPARSARPDFRMPRGALREVGPPPPSRVAATLPVADNLHIGVGRFVVPELAGRRTNIEPVRRPTDMRRRDRAIAAVGFNFSF